MIGAECAVPDCELPARPRVIFCPEHYEAKKRHGHPLKLCVCGCDTWMHHGSGYHGERGKRKCATTDCKCLNYTPAEFTA